MRAYRFLTTWLIGAPRGPIFEALWESERWPAWWPGVIAAREVDRGDPATGVGRRGLYEWRSTIPYPVRFEVVATRVQPPGLLEGRVSGDLIGRGRWRLFGADGPEPATAVLYEWEVSTAKRWMNAVAPLAAPVFRWNHDQLMRRGGEGLARELGVPLLARD